VDWLTGFSHLLAPQLLVSSADEEVEVVVDSARTSITRSGTAILIIVPSIAPIARPTGIRDPSLTIFATSRSSITTRYRTQRRKVDLREDQRRQIYQAEGVVEEGTKVHVRGATIFLSPTRSQVVVKGKIIVIIDWIVVS
jgi:hypothetical protein